MKFNIKFFLFLFLILVITIITSPITLAVETNPINYNNLCSDFNNGIGAAFKIIGYVVLIAKWIIPLIIIILGMVDFGKAAISSDDKEIMKASKTLLNRFITGVIVFFVPQLILAILNVIDITDGIENNTRFGTCTKCILNAPEFCPLNGSDE